MPSYCYKCDECGREVTETRPVGERDMVFACGQPCPGTLQRDMPAEWATHRQSGEGTEWVSVNAGVDPSQVAEANKTYDGLATFDSDGRAHVMPRNMEKFLTKRGLHRKEGPPSHRNSRTKVYRYNPENCKLQQVTP